jgi:hypothetical protein
MASVGARRCDVSPNRINLDRHSWLIERTHRFTKAFEFGLRAGNPGAETQPEHDPEGDAAAMNPMVPKELAEAESSLRNG